MSVLVSFRNYNRSQRVRVGGKVLNATSDTLLNVDSPRVQRDLARHSAIGAIHEGARGRIFQADDGYLTGGGVVANRATGLVVDISATSWVNAAKVAGNAAAGTATVGAADGTNPRIDIVVVNTGSGAYSVVAGTATANATLALQRPGQTTNTLAGIAAVPASSIALAYILVPANATNLTAANVLDVRP